MDDILIDTGGFLADESDTSIPSADGSQSDLESPAPDIPVSVDQDPEEDQEQEEEQEQEQEEEQEQEDQEQEEDEFEVIDLNDEFDDEAFFESSPSYDLDDVYDSLSAELNASYLGLTEQIDFLQKTVDDLPISDSDALSAISSSLDGIAEQLALLSDTPYNGTISSGILDYFDRLSTSFKWFDDYVLYRSGQYVYDCYVGDITYSNGVFTSSATNRYRLITGGTGVTSYQWGVKSGEPLDLSAGSAVVYSSLGSYPTLKCAESFPFTLFFIVFMTFVLGVFFRGLWSFTMRPKLR